MKTSTFVALVLFAGLMYGSAFAQDKTPVVDQREKNQQARIEEGVKSGELTNRETIQLERQEGKIKADELNAKADGKVTKRERAKLHRELNRESRAIYRKKHNGRVGN